MAKQLADQRTNINVPSLVSDIVAVKSAGQPKPEPMTSKNDPAKAPWAK